MAIFVGRNYVLSVRRKTPQGFQNVRARAEAEPENLARGSGFVLYAIMDTVVDRYFPVLARLEADLERLETEIFRGVPSAANIEAFYDLKYRLMVLKHAVASLMEAPRNCSVDGCRRCAWAPRSTSATSSITSSASTPRSTVNARCCRPASR